MRSGDSVFPQSPLDFYRLSNIAGPAPAILANCHQCIYPVTSRSRWFGFWGDGWDRRRRSECVSVDGFESDSKPFSIRHQKSNIVAAVSGYHQPKLPSMVKKFFLRTNFAGCDGSLKRRFRGHYLLETISLIEMMSKWTIV